MKRLSVITPTCGRRSLLSTIGSVLDTIGPEDEFIIIKDGDIELEYVPADPRIKVLSVAGHRSGNPQRDLGMAHATGDYLIFLDDDDILVRNGLAALHKCIAGLDPPAPVMISIAHLPYNRTLNKPAYGRDVENCGSRLVAPNTPGKLGVWDDPTATDRLSASYRNFNFIEQTLAHYNNKPVWLDTILICVPSVGIGRLPNEG